MAENKDYYAILGVSRDASEDEIRSAFRKMSKKYHPDLNHAPGAEEKFKEVNEAYQVLSDKDKKANYDQYGSADGPMGGGAGGFGGAGGGFRAFGGGSGFDDIFSSFFGGAQQAGGRTQPAAGADLQYRMDLTFEEGVFGKTTNISYNRQGRCHVCKGSGAANGEDPITCTKCHGRGFITVQRNTPLGVMQSRVTCDVCNGTGKEIKDKCTNCHGSGVEQERHTIEVKVPAGILDGQQMRLDNAGEAGKNNAPYGDLYVVFRVAPSNIYTRDGADILMDMDISFAQAALGDNVKADTVHGAVELKIPAGTQSGTKMRLRGKGAPRLQSTGNGDEIVTVKIHTPKHLNADQKDSLMQFAAASGQHVKPHESSLFDKVRDAFKNK